jgi:hypothetical protein
LNFGGIIYDQDGRFHRIMSDVSHRGVCLSNIAYKYSGPIALFIYVLIFGTAPRSGNHKPTVMGLEQRNQ